MNMAKVKRLLVPSGLLLECLGPYPDGRTMRFVSDGIPPDAEIVAVHLCAVRTVELVLCSDEFPELAQGSLIPLLIPICSVTAFQQVDGEGAAVEGDK